jgi:hypothetical protein
MVMVFLRPYDSSMKEKTSVTLSPQVFERQATAEPEQNLHDPPSSKISCVNAYGSGRARATRRALSNFSIEARKGLPATPKPALEDQARDQE